MKIETKNLSWQPTSKSPWILNQVNFTAKKGQCIGLLGPNGCGKTTLIRCLYRSLQATNGTVLLDSRDIQSYSRQVLAQKIAVVMQEYPPDFHLSVEEIIQLGKLPHASFFLNNIAGNDEDDEIVMQKLELEHLRYRAFNTLSGGEKQRVMIARALAQKTEALLLDEPTNHLDISHQLSILKLTRELGITVISSLHDLNLAAQFCDEVAVMNDGHIVSQGTPRKVLTTTLISDVFSVQSTADSHPQTGSLRLSFH